MWWVQQIGEHVKRTEHAAIGEARVNRKAHNAATKERRDIRATAEALQKTREAAAPCAVASRRRG